MQMAAIEIISVIKEIVKASWTNIQHDSVAPFKLSERLPVPPALSGKDPPAGWTQVLNVCLITRIDRHPVEHDENRAPECISVTKHWLDWNGELDNLNNGEND